MGQMHYIYSGCFFSFFSLRRMEAYHNISAFILWKDLQLIHSVNLLRALPMERRDEFSGTRQVVPGKLV